MKIKELRQLNLDKLKRLNAPKQGVKIKALVFDVRYPYDSEIVKFKPTDLFENGEFGVHGLYVGTTIKIINPEVELYGASYTNDFDSVVDYCIENDIRIINTSFSTRRTREKDNAIQRFSKWGGIWVSSSGNDGDELVSFPANSDYTVGVSATNTPDNNGEEVDTTADSWWVVYDHKDRKQHFNGTSASTPVISAVASYYLNWYPNGDLNSFIDWINMNEVDDLSKVLEYDGLGKLEDGEKFFVFPKEVYMFKDVEKGDWFYHNIKLVKEEGLMSGYTDGSFNPNEPITRAELATVISNIIRKYNLNK